MTVSCPVVRQTKLLHAHAMVEAKEVAVPSAHADQMGQIAPGRRRCDWAREINFGKLSFYIRSLNSFMEKPDAYAEVAISPS